MDRSIELAIGLIKQFEGCKLTAYQDQAAVWTIGWGTTAPTVLSFLDKVTYTLPAQGVVWTQDQADRALEEAVEMVASGVLSVLQAVPTHLSDNQLAALLDFVYNLGIGNFERSGVLRALKIGNFPAAADNLLLWDKIGPYTSPGLTRRREAERALFLSLDTALPTNNPTLPVVD